MEKEGIARFNCVQSILEDKDGSLWVGFSGGLFHLKGEEFLHIGKEELKMENYRNENFPFSIHHFPCLALFKY